MSRETTAQPSAAETPDFSDLRLRSERLLLLPWGEEHIDAITEACQDPEIQRYVPVPSPYTRTDAETFVRDVAPAGRAAGTDIVFGVVHAETGAVLGAVGLHRLHHLGASFGGVGELGYWCAPWARGHGYTTEAAREVCAFAFEHLELARIEWVALVGNEASWRVARRLGFAREGTLRAAMPFRDVRQDAWVGSLLRTEWHGAQTGRE